VLPGLWISDLHLREDFDKDFSIGAGVVFLLLNVTLLPLLSAGGTAMFSLKEDVFDSDLLSFAFTLSMTLLLLCLLLGDLVPAPPPSGDSGCDLPLPLASLEIAVSTGGMKRQLSDSALVMGCMCAVVVGEVDSRRGRSRLKGKDIAVKK
jgi:hypothetical protein